MPTSKLRAPTLAALHALLRPLGFQKVSGLYSRATQNIVHLIEVQGSRASTKEEARITVNVGAFVPELVYADVRETTKPSIPGAHWRTRLGHLSPEHTDLWWHIANEEQAFAAAQDIASRVQAYALPALAELPNSTALVAQWQAGNARGLTEPQRKEYLARLGGGQPHAHSVV